MHGCVKIGFDLGKYFIAVLEQSRKIWFICSEVLNTNFL